MSDEQAPLVVVTGSSDGIGLAIATRFVAGGARVILHGRDRARLEAARQTVAAAARPPGKVVAAESADLASLSDVSRLAERLSVWGPLHALVNNAGVFLNERRVTVDGFEATFAINHLAHVRLTHLLIPVFAPTARVVNTSSGAHFGARLQWNDLQSAQNFEGHAAYALSKLANVLFTVELARRAPFSVNAFHPGVVTTKLLRAGFGSKGPDKAEAAADYAWTLALDPGTAGLTGTYMSQGRTATPHPVVSDATTAARFYQVSCALAGVLPLPPRPA